MKTLEKILDWIWEGTQSKKKCYIAYPVCNNSPLSPIPIMASCIHEANKMAKEFETNGVHIVSVEAQID